MKFLPKTKLSGRKSCPKELARTLSIVPGSRSTKIALKFWLNFKQKKQKLFPANFAIIVNSGNVHPANYFHNNLIFLTYLSDFLSPI